MRLPMCFGFWSCLHESVVVDGTSRHQDDNFPIYFASNLQLSTLRRRRCS